MKTHEQVVARYRGFVLVISERDVLVLDARGRTHLGRCASVSSARRFVRGWEREQRREATCLAV